MVERDFPDKAATRPQLTKYQPCRQNHDGLGATTVSDSQRTICQHRKEATAREIEVGTLGRRVAYPAHAILATLYQTHEYKVAYPV